jgi:hypothetical protein
LRVYRLWPAITTTSLGLSAFAIPIALVIPPLVVRLEIHKSLGTFLLDLHVFVCSIET